jgi:hypothetical protein
MSTSGDIKVGVLEVTAFPCIVQYVYKVLSANKTCILACATDHRKRVMFSESDSAVSLLLHLEYLRKTASVV